MRPKLNLIKKVLKLLILSRKEATSDDSFYNLKGLLESLDYDTLKPPES